MSVSKKAALTVVTLSISPVVPEVGVLLEVLSYTCCSHPGALQKQHKNEVGDLLTAAERIQVCPKIVRDSIVYYSELKILTSKSAANMSSDSVNMSGAEGFFGLAPATNKNNHTNAG